MDFNHNNKVNEYYAELAKKFNLPYRIIDQSTIDVNLLQLNERLNYIQMQAIPIKKGNNQLTIATANPDLKNLALIKQYWQQNSSDIQLEIVISSRHSIVEILSAVFAKHYTYECSNQHRDNDVLHSASYNLSFKQKILVIVLLIIIVIGLILDFSKNDPFYFYSTLFWFNLFLAIGTLIVLSYKFFLAIMTLTSQQVAEHRKDEYFELAGLELPLYTVLVPMLREKKSTIEFLFKALNRLDYPHEKLDIKLLLEQDDQQTLSIIKEFDWPVHCQLMMVPAGFPRSKPRACNYGLAFAFGEYLTIYDAEDCPDKDQLRKALQKFYKHVERYRDDKLVCIQAKLNFYNSRENLLTRLFTLEYTHWFDLLIPALAYLRDPVPLGGTSNHFKVWFLREVCGWDPYIGTEDADIGMRIYRRGYFTTTVNSTTYEEANTKIINWLKQRARWNKGYLQTYLVNMRDPIKMIRQIGIREFISFQIFVGGNVFVSLANLPLWLIFFVVILIPHRYYEFFPMYVLFLCYFNFFLGNALLLVAEFIGAYRRHFFGLLLYVPMVLVYWMLMSIAGYMALFDWVVRPSYWYKTEHGISKESPRI